jgi:hypothetical protein
MDIIDSKLMILRRALSRVTGESIQAGSDSMGNQRVVLGNAEYAELGIARKIYIANSLAGTAFAPAAAPPTTSPSWCLWNGDTRRSLVMLSCGIISISGTLGLGLSMVGAVTIQAQLDATMAAYSGAVVKGASGQAGDANCRVVNNPTILGTPAYDILAARDQVSAVSVGSGLVADLKGAFIVPPGFAFVLEPVAPLGTTALFAVSFRFASLDLELTEG